MSDYDGLRARIADALYRAPAIPTRDTERFRREEAEADANNVLFVIKPALAALNDRAQALEAENRRLRDDLAHARAFAWVAPGGRVRMERVGADRWWIDRDDNTIALIEGQAAALARARNLAEGTERG